MLLLISLICFGIGLYSIRSARKSLATGRVELEDGFSLKRKRNPFRFRLSIASGFIFGGGMIIFAVIAAIVYFAKITGKLP